MSKNVWIASSLAVAGLGLVVAAFAPTLVVALDDDSFEYTCVMVARGSKAAPPTGDEENRELDAHGGSHGNGGGGGGPKCSSTFGSWADTTLTYYVSDVGAPAAVSGNLSGFLAAAFSEWSCHSGIGEGLTLSQVGSAAGADIVVSWDDLGSQGILGVTNISGFGSTITHTTIRMNSNQAAFSWTAGPGIDVDADGCIIEDPDQNVSGYDLASVTIHEVGHVFGVGHSNGRCSSRDTCYPQTMYSCTGPGEFSRRTLNTGDIAAITKLYGVDL